MSRYFIEVAYIGTNYSGFQIQDNANTIQQEVENVLTIYYKEKIALTGSSRTDAGVHATCNYFHFDSEVTISLSNIYNINALLPNDIVVKQLLPVSPTA
ncbi:MAG: tRNA pseudouridine(38-40) synthase TruA, partial [Chitinophagaceae bacterium]|nr:tRNA pseudouridine(38-40) synthase TruA [Chitinophagaceae bacterium]